MAYEKTVWKNREVERPRTFEVMENPDGTITLIPSEGEIIEPGTPIIADNMNKIEVGIEEAHNELENKETPTGAQAKADAAEAAANAYTDQEVGDLAGDGRTTETVKGNTDALTAHLADYTLQVPYAEATGSANSYSVTLDPAPASLVSGLAVAVKINVDNTGASTININSLGAKTIKKPNGNDVAAGNLKAGSVYTLRYNGTNFILQGEGGEYGTATAGDVLSGKTIGTETGLVTGTMVNQGAKIITPSTVNQAIVAGYHNGSGYVKGDANLLAANIASGKSIFGVAGNVVPASSIVISGNKEQSMISVKSVTITLGWQAKVIWCTVERWASGTLQETEWCSYWEDAKTGAASYNKSNYRYVISTVTSTNFTITFDTGDMNTMKIWYYAVKKL